MYSGYKFMKWLPNFVARRPHVVEYDFAGVVIDANDTALQNGQEVYGFVSVGKLHSSNCLAQ